jgi:hypothetical protein
LVESNKIVIELTINEARILRNSVASSIPLMENEMITMMLYARITRKLEEATGKNESL